MEIFLSWSGYESKRIALKFRSWLPELIPGVKGFVSEEDIDSGATWGPKIYGMLKRCQYGLVFVTHQNIDAPWVNFEAGALHIATAKERVSPFLCGVRPADIKDSPLSQFQCTVPTRDSILRLMKTLNTLKGKNAEPEEVLYRRFDRAWPELDAELIDFNSSENSLLEYNGSISAGLTNFFNISSPIQQLSIFALNTQTILLLLETLPAVRIYNVKIILASASCVDWLYRRDNQLIAESPETAVSDIEKGRKSSIEAWKQREQRLGEKLEIRYSDIFPTQYTLLADKKWALQGFYRFDETKRRHGLLPGDPLFADSKQSIGFVNHLNQWFEEHWCRSYV